MDTKSQTPSIRRNTIINGDCVKVMPELPSRSVHFILTDPPYLINYTSRDGRKVPNDNNDTWLKPAFAQMYRVLKHNSFCVSFYGYRHADKFTVSFEKQSCDTKDTPKPAMFDLDELLLNMETLFSTMKTIVIKDSYLCSSIQGNKIYFFSINA